MLLGENSAEPGGDAGSDFVLQKGSDVGTTSEVLRIRRSDGQATFSTIPIAPTPTAGDSSTKVATTAFVANKVTALGLGTMATQNANAVAITGGSITGTPISGSTGSFTTLSASGVVSGAGFTTLLNPYAKVDSQVFTGTPSLPTGTTAITQTALNNSTKVATTAYVDGAITAKGLGTMSTQNANAVAITGGAINGTTVGATTPSTGAFTTLSASGVVSGAGFTTLLNPYALVNSQVFTGTPSLPTGTIGVTQAAADNSTKLATTAYVKSQSYLTANQTITHTGDVTGSGTTSIPNTVVQLQGRPLSASAPATGNLMGWNGSAWGPVAAGAVAAGGTNGQIQYNNAGVLGGLTLNGSGAPAGTTGVVFSGTTQINGGALGSTIGTTIIPLNVYVTDTNGDNIRTEIQRKSAGSDWSTAAWQIYRQVDSTKMGYIEFNSGSSKPIAFGNGTTEYASIDNTAKLSLAGNLAVAEAASINGVNPSVSLSKNASGGTSRVVGYMAGSARWQMMFGDSAAESGSNAGSNFGLQRYSDASSLIDTPLSINRATGQATFSQPINAPGLDFRNRLLNGNFIIDQYHNFAGFAAVTGMLCDRWTFGSAPATSRFNAQVVNNSNALLGLGFTNYLTFSVASPYAVTAGDYFAFYQGIEGFNWADMGFGTAAAKSVTLSFWAACSVAGLHSGALRNYANSRSCPFTYTVATANTWNKYTVTIPGDTAGTWVGQSNAGAATLAFSLGTGATYSAAAAGAWAAGNYLAATGDVGVVQTNAAVFSITGIQLEAGSVATPFELRPYALELQYCQRYYQTGTGTLSGYSSGTGGVFYCTTVLSPQMRGGPPTINLAPSGGGGWTSVIAVIPTVGSFVQQATGGGAGIMSWAYTFTASAEI
jgi:hypothetical protein